MDKGFYKEIVVADKRLGRHIDHDPRSLRYTVKPRGVIVSRAWTRILGILDQGNVGSCTGNALVGALGTNPDYARLSSAQAKLLGEPLALELYSAAEDIDGDGPYPPNDNGSSGLSVAKAAKARGLINGYTHITSIDAAFTAIANGPFIVGSDWYSGFDSPTNGLVKISGSIRGGHEYECVAYDAQTDLWTFANSWGYGYAKSGFFSYSSATFETLLADQGDATVLVPLTAPAPVPDPAPAGDAADKALVAAGNAWEPGILSRLTKAGRFKSAFDTWKVAKGL
jgi:hypothetical protein